MKAANPYLTFDGNAEEAFTFYKSVFGGDLAVVVRFRDMGAGPPGTPPHELAEKRGSCADRFGVQWMVSYTGSVQFSPGQGG